MIKNQLEELFGPLNDFRPYYHVEDGCLKIVFSDESHYECRETPNLTVYRSNETKDIVGLKVRSDFKDSFCLEKFMELEQKYEQRGWLILWQNTRRWEWHDGSYREALEIATENNRHLTERGDTIGFSIVHRPKEPKIQLDTFEDRLLEFIFSD